MYVSRAQARIGCAFDYAINVCRISGTFFVDLFNVSRISKAIERGDPAYLLGKSGIELAICIFDELNAPIERQSPEDRLIRTPEYWIGWAITYYQWHSGRSFHQIFDALPFDVLQKMYHPLHEADISKVVDVFDSKVREHFPDVNLKRLRKQLNLTQAELADRSGVSLRSIQMYEQRNKDINKASVETVYRLSKALYCRAEDLIER